MTPLLRRLLPLLAAGWLLLPPAGAWAQAAPPAIALFFQKTVLGGAELSPDGQRVALRVRTGDGKARLAVLELATMAPTVVADFRDVDIGAFSWVNDQRLVFTTEPAPAAPGRVMTGPGLFGVNADGGEYRPLVETDLTPPMAADSSMPLLATRTRQGWMSTAENGVPLLPWRTRLLRASADRTGNDVWVTVPDEVGEQKADHLVLRRLNTVSGRAEDVASPPNSVGWTMGSDDQLRLVTSRKDNQATVRWRDPSGTWRALASFDPVRPPWQPRFIGPDNTLYVTATHQGYDAVFTLDAASGRRSDLPLAAVKGFDLRPGFIVGRGKLLGLRYTIDAEIAQWLDADAKALQATVDGLLPATANRLSLPRRGDAPYVLVQAFADVQPMLTYVYNTRTQKLTRLGASHPGIDPRQMGQTDFVRYKAADGREIPAYLTLPPGVAAGAGRKNLPLVVLVHDGPSVRGARWEWQAEVQFLATRGYAVLQPEFRGGTGFGFDHFEAGWKQWGQAMQTDLADGARWAIAQGIANPKRIAIAGAGYGGYATLMGLLRNPELFRAGISWAAVTDPMMMFSADGSDMGDDGKKFAISTTLGDPLADAAMLKANSPLEQAARIKQPLLLAHGGWDMQVPIVHGEKFRDANKPHNPQLDWVVYPEEGHGWQKPEANLDFWGRAARFLARHLAAE